MYVSLAILLPSPSAAIAHHRHMAGVLVLAEHWMESSVIELAGRIAPDF